MLKERQKSILDAIIRDYIRTAHPVASGDLVRKFRLGVSPATARNEMLKLDEQGYLEQPHTSAGRIPTDRGYRFFVDDLMGDFPLLENERKIITELFKITDAKEFVRDAARAISRMSRIFAALGLAGEKIFYGAGFSEVLDEPEFMRQESVRTFARLLDNLEDEVREIYQNFKDVDERIFIGEENRMEDASSCALFVSRFKHHRGFEGFITLVGPKRTNYPKHRAILREMHRYKYKS